MHRNFGRGASSIRPKEITAMSFKNHMRIGMVVLFCAVAGPLLLTPSVYPMSSRVAAIGGSIAFIGGIAMARSVWRIGVFSWISYQIFCDTGIADERTARRIDDPDEHDRTPSLPPAVVDYLGATHVRPRAWTDEAKDLLRQALIAGEVGLYASRKIRDGTNAVSDAFVRISSENQSRRSFSSCGDNIAWRSLRPLPCSIRSIMRLESTSDTLSETTSETRKPAP